MPDTIQVAASGRSKCRGCGRAIIGGELRFGESQPNPYAEGETLSWFHLACAACMRPERFLPALDACPLKITERTWLADASKIGVSHRRLCRLARAERAPSGRARCRQCHEFIEKGRVRLALHLFEDGRFNPIGTIHAECAEAYLGTADVQARLARIQEMDEGLRRDLSDQLGQQRFTADTLVVGSNAEDMSSRPGLARTDVKEELRVKRKTQ